jgi:hypothetical protein
MKVPLVSPLRVPVIISWRKPEPAGPAAGFVGVMGSSVCAVNVNVKVPPAPAVVGTVMTKFDAPVNTERVVGLRVTTEPAATSKFPVDAELDPGLVMVFAVVFNAMFGPGVRAAVPPFPRFIVKFPEATVVGTAYA